MTWVRIVAILVGAFVMFTLERDLGFQWYWAAALALLSYFIVRYFGWGLRQRAEMNAMAEEIMRRRNSN